MNNMENIPEQSIIFSEEYREIENRIKKMADDEVKFKLAVSLH